MPAFPSTFPCPLIEPTSYEAATNLVRTEFECGLIKQRRNHRRMTRTFNLAFMVKQTREYGDWLVWADKEAWKGFTIDLPSDLAGLLALELTSHSMRFISDLRTQLVNTTKGYYWRVDVTAESLTYGSGKIQDDWIIARDPANPSPDWIIARDPANPSPDWVISSDVRVI
jgi:hypothetical protein